ncbi:hypothetical protein CLU79DRAFT_673923, partial [Phycomyces nitens]
PPTPTEFSVWRLSENVKSIDINPLGHSRDLRFWIHEFKQEAAAVDAPLDYCVRVLRKYMPPAIRNWLSTLPTATRASWNLMEPELLKRFAPAAAVDDRLIIGKLRK